MGERDKGIRPWSKGEITERRFLRQGDRLYDLSKLQNPTDRAQAALEIRDAAFESLSQNRLVHFEFFTDKDIANDPDLAERVFTGFRPDGKLLGLFHLAYNSEPEKRLTVSIFELPTGELIVHRTAPRGWDMYFDGSTAVVIAVATGVIYKPQARMSIVDLGEAPSSWQQMLDIVCLGFHPDENTYGTGSWTPYPRLILDGAKSS